MSGRSADTAKHILLYLVTMLISLTVHEFAHALVAERLGDDTPRRQGRVTLSPLAHYDLFGTFLVPLMGILASVPFFGWARPVETNPGRYTRKISMRNGHRLVAAAGPLSNLFLAVLAMGGLFAVSSGMPGWVRPGGFSGGALYLLVALVHVNLGLFVLNLLPIPPLDGSRLLPSRLDGFQQTIAPYSFVIMLVIVNVPALRFVLVRPVMLLGAVLESLFGVPVGFA